MNKLINRALSHNSGLRQSRSLILISMLSLLTLSIEALANNVNDSKLVRYVLDGTITGLTSPGLVLRNGATTRLIHAGSSTFEVGSFPAESSYSVTIAAQPWAQVCTVTNGANVVSKPN